MAYIKKEPLCAWLKNMGTSDFIIRRVESEEHFPSADVVEVTRCKNCQHYEADIICEGVGYCNEHQKGMRDNNFCSSGEKRKDDDV